MTFEEIDLKENIDKHVFVKTCQCGINSFDNSESKRSKIIFIIGHVFIFMHLFNLPKLWSNNETSKRYAIGSLFWLIFSIIVISYSFLFIKFKMV
ncbi:hypothetical protein DDB_G0286571 [Dictyostelium discoideum AX4]|uniref:Transmembrane protein n=1 Tax=Dictyostelium discoideum TaxID=44689 RepID=Q54LM3_DICDI|nr:hypothetical protein DDB_G0286571 [Dictyostelium discoideum AX4]EAL64041.1 hypothetical protein DDB_G0286571 [Dictyostelium discoideum AX4]|eukprot:XP_637538.1 hypothetical protein DDB_G0286571 [Dictyostelium discoideum AX4]